MTHNIVAQFSCSIDSHGVPHEYRVVNGSIFNEEYNETLDSGTIVLSQISKKLRLALIQPYVFVHVFDKSSAYDPETGKYDFDKIFLVDNFDEKENNIKEHIYGYSINLMSETKLLEKIQCPNLTATHNLDKNGHVVKKTIYEYINQYMFLYVPKMKYSANGQTWDYVPLISCPKGKETTIVNDSVESDFDSEDLHEFGHGQELYYLETNIAIEDEGIDLDSVEYLGWSGGGDADFFDVTVEYNNGEFYFKGYTRNGSAEGTITINFAYEKTVIEETEFFKRFNVPCADLPFNVPTLRQLLTMLMQQVGCIPVVRNRTLSFLDFQKDAKLFGNGDYTLKDTVNFIRRSLSSDSFVNTLVNISDNVLDSGNEVVCETLGFRDKENLLLKQTENLKLETSLPIYKVNKCVMHAPGRYTGMLSSSVGCISDYNSLSQTYPIIIYKDIELNDNKIKIKFCVFENSFNNYSEYFNVEISKRTIYLLGKRSNGSYYIVSEEECLDDFELNANNTVREEYVFPELNNHSEVFYTKTFNFEFDSNIASSVIGFSFSGTFIDDQGRQKEFSFVKFDEGNSNVKYFGWRESNVSLENAIFAGYSLSFAGNRNWDITKLVVEKSKRQLLERNFVDMENEVSNNQKDWTIDVLSKYVYGTVGYSIGSKEITGFSEVYNVGSHGIAWIQAGYTYIENIVNALKYQYNDSQAYDLLTSFFEFIKYFPIVNDGDDSSIHSLSYSQYLFVGLDFDYYSPIGQNFSSSPFFTTFIFDIWYQPLNSFNLAYVKTQEPVDYALEQYDGNSSGLTDFDRLSIHEQEQVDRIGNEVVSINQRTNNPNLIQDFKNGPLVFRDDTNRDGIINDDDKGVDYIIFKRSIAINNNCYNVTYVGSKDAVLKNYFTSIRTKYRAYQYIDYNSSVLRKERDTLFVRVASSTYDGDNKIKVRHNCLANFIYDFKNDEEKLGYKRNISYEVETNYANVSDGVNNPEIVEQTVKNSVSLVTSNNMMAIVYEYTDNVGVGTYIKDLKIGEAQNGGKLGGIAQYWQIWNSSYNIKHQVAFTNYIDFYSNQVSEGNINQNADVITTQIGKLCKSPIVDPTYNYDIIFSVVDDNKSNVDKRTFFKDVAERISHTVQFIYYSPDNDILMNEAFISGIPLINRFDKTFNACVSTDKFGIRKEEYSVSELKASDELINGGINRLSIVNNQESGISKLRVNFSSLPSGHNVLKICHYDAENQKLYDIAVFKKGVGNTKDYYFTINDTKTDYVLTDYHGILYRRYKVKTYSTANGEYPREVVKIYNEEDD